MTPNCRTLRQGVNDSAIAQYIFTLSFIGVDGVDISTPDKTFGICLTF